MWSQIQHFNTIECVFVQPGGITCEVNHSTKNTDKIVHDDCSRNQKKKDAITVAMCGHVSLHPCMQATMDCMPDWMNQPSGARAKNTAGHVGNKHSNYPYHKHAEYCKLITLVGSSLQGA